MYYGRQLIIELSNCTIGYKKIINSKEVDIDSSYEIVKDGILSVNKNIMTNKFPNVTYVCDVAYKGTSIRLYVSFSLAEQGVGIQNITTYYLASSKSKDIRVDSEGWTTSIQTINEIINIYGHIQLQIIQMVHQEQVNHL